MALSAFAVRSGEETRQVQMVCQGFPVTRSRLAYAGLRPAEATALAWRHVGERTLLVEQSADGEGGTKVTKTGVIRTVPLLAPLADDLAAWRAALRRMSRSSWNFDGGPGDGYAVASVAASSRVGAVGAAARSCSIAMTSLARSL